jgi:hypothetical protein
MEYGDQARFHGEWSGKGWYNGLIFRGYGFQPNIAENFTNWWRHTPNGFDKNVGGGETYAPISSHMQTPEGP